MQNRKIPQIIHENTKTPNRSYQVSKGWAPVRVMKNGNWRTEWRCPVVQKAPFSDELRRCCFTCRKHLINSHKHHCFLIPHDIDTYFKLETNSLMNQPQMTINHVSQQILDLIAKFGCDENISSLKLEKQPMKEFVRCILALGIDLNQNGIGKEYLSAIRFYSAPTISKRIIDYGNKIKQDQFMRLKEIRFINLLIDSGTVNKFKCVHVLASNPHYYEMPVLLEVMENTNYSKEDYELLFQNIFEKSKELNLTIVSLICDNLPAQVGGVKGFLNSPDKNIQAILHVPCLAHMCNLIFIQCYKKLEVMKDIVNHTNFLINLLRKPKYSEVMGQLCPKYIQTRWLFIYDSLLYIMENRILISELLSADNSENAYISDELIDLFLLLTPLKLFLLQIERRDGCLYWVVDCMHELLQQWKSISNKLKTEIGIEILNMLSSLFLFKIFQNNFEAISASYLLSKNGRLNVRRIEAGYSVEGIENDEDVTLPYVMEMKRRFELWINICDHNEDQQASSSFYYDDEEYDSSDSDYIYTHDDNCDSDDDENWANDSDYDIERDIENENVSTYINSDENLNNDELLRSVLIKYNDAEENESDGSLFKEIFNMHIETKLDINLYHKVYEYGSKKNLETASILGMNTNTINSCLYSWLCKNHKDIIVFKDLYKTNENDLWRKAHMFSQWREFSDLAIRFISIGTSEADVERSFSLQKSIANLYTYNINPETMESRLRARQEISNKNRKI